MHSVLVFGAIPLKNVDGSSILLIGTKVAVARTRGTSQIGGGKTLGEGIQLLKVGI